MVLKHLSKTPFLILFLIFMDFVFIFQSLVVKPILNFFYYLSCGFLETEKLKCINTFEDSMFRVVFGMRKPEIEGFRRLRTIT